MDKNALEQLLSSYNWWMGLSTIAVAVGILGEYVAHFIFEKEARRNKGEMALSIFFGVLVLSGVVGEYIFGNRLSQVAEKLQRMADVEIAQANEKSGRANERAAELEKEAESERLARVELEHKMQWRQLSKAQGNAFCSAIPKTPLDFIRFVGVASSSQDSEAFRYARDFSEVLNACMTARGERPSGGVGNRFWGENVVFGVWVEYAKHLTLDDPKSPILTYNPRKRRALAFAVRRALEAHGVKVEGVSDNGGHLLEIYVGPISPPALHRGAITPTVNKLITIQ